MGVRLGQRLDEGLGFWLSLRIRLGEWLGMGFWLGLGRRLGLRLRPGLGWCEGLGGLWRRERLGQGLRGLAERLRLLLMLLLLGAGGV